MVIAHKRLLNLCFLRAFRHILHGDAVVYCRWTTTILGVLMSDVELC